MAKPKQTSVLSFFENRSSVTSNSNEKEVDVNSINTQNECKDEASCSEPQFEELLSVMLRSSDCVGGVHNDEICVIEDSSESGEEDFDEIKDVTVSETECIADCCSCCVLLLVYQTYKSLYHSIYRLIFAQ